MRRCSLKHILIPSILLLLALSQSAGAQTPQRDKRPRTASISGRVTIHGKPAANAAVTVIDNAFKTHGDDSEPPIRFQTKARTDGDGRYMVGGLAEGRYHVSAAVNVFVDPGKLLDPDAGRMVTLDEGEARENMDFSLVRGGVITGKVTDNEGAPLIAKHVQLYILDEQGQTSTYPSSSEMSETDDRGVYRLYGLPPGRYIISASGEDAKFLTTWHPDTTDEKQARIMDIKEGSEIAEVDIRFGGGRKTYQAYGRVVDRETRKPIPGIYILCRMIEGKEDASLRYGVTSVADGQGNFKATGLLPGRYIAAARDVLGDAGYTSDTAEFEVTNDNVSGVEVKAFLGASVSGFVVVEGAAAADRLQSIMVFPIVTPPNDANNSSSIPPFVRPVNVNADGGFAIKGLGAGRVGFTLFPVPEGPRIKRIERDGVEIKDAIEVRAGENITGVRIVAFNPQGGIRGRFQIVGGALPDGWQLAVNARRSASAGESNSGGSASVSNYTQTGYASVDEKGRFMIERLAPGEYDLTVTLTKLIANGQRQSVGLRELNRRVTVVENGPTPITIDLDLNRINSPQNQPNNLEDRR